MTPDHDHTKDNCGDRKYSAPGGAAACLSRHLQPLGRVPPLYSLLRQAKNEMGALYYIPRVQGLAMVLDLVCSPLALVVLVGLFDMLVLACPSEYGAAWHSPAKPMKTTRKCPRALRPFVGLTRRPSWYAHE